MSQFSETMGSFIRTGNYPLEAHYIFNSEQELRDFYADAINSTLLHKGLFKIVSSKDKLILYWVISKDGELILEPLITSNSIIDLLQEIHELRTDLEDQISNIDSRITQILGTEDYSDFKEGLNNLLDISNMLLEIKTLAEKHTEELKTLVGTEDSIIPTLELLPYKNFILVVNILRAFFGDEVLEDFNTLKKIQDVIYKISITCKNNIDNLQSELNQTLLGVGLDSSGMYSPDLETNYLHTASSVMNALRILDGKVKEALTGISIVPGDSSIIPITISKNSEGYSIEADLKLSSTLSNDLLKLQDGLYTNSNLEYDSGILTYKVNDKIVSQYNIGLTSVVEDAYYDTTTETIMLIFKLVDGNNLIVKIPAHNLIREWEVDNSKPDQTIEFTREEVINGPDRLSGDVRLVASKNNILEKRGNALIVEGTSSNITHNGLNLDTVIESLKTTAELSNYYTKEEINSIIKNISGFESYDSFELFPEQGIPNVLYLDNTSKTFYIWSNEGYLNITSSLELGEVEGTAYPGDKGASDHNILSNIRECVITGGKIPYRHILKLGENESGSPILTTDSTVRFTFVASRYDLNGKMPSYDNLVFEIPSATSTNAGVLSANDKTKLDSLSTSNFNNKYVVSTAPGGSGFSMLYYDNYLTLTLPLLNPESGQEDSYSLIFSPASEENGGIMSAEHYSKLNQLSDIYSVDGVSVSLENNNLSILCADDKNRLSIISTTSTTPIHANVDYDMDGSGLYIDGKVYVYDGSRDLNLNATNLVEEKGLYTIVKDLESKISESGGISDENQTTLNKVNDILNTRGFLCVRDESNVPHPYIISRDTTCDILFTLYDPADASYKYNTLSIPVALSDRAGLLSGEMFDQFTQMLQNLGELDTDINDIRGTLLTLQNKKDWYEEL